MAGLVSLGVLALLVFGLLVLGGVILAFLGLGALFGTWFTSGGSHLDKKPTKDEMADIFVPRKPVDRQRDPFCR